LAHDRVTGPTRAQPRRPPAAADAVAHPGRAPGAAVGVAARRAIEVGEAQAAGGRARVGVARGAGDASRAGRTGPHAVVGLASCLGPKAVARSFAAVEGAQALAAVGQPRVSLTEGAVGAGATTVGDALAGACGRVAVKARRAAAALGRPAETAGG
jgi:hypothetical protein